MADGAAVLIETDAGVNTSFNAQFVRESLALDRVRHRHFRNPAAIFVSARR